MTSRHNEFRDYLVRLDVEQWCEGESTVNEIVLRVAGLDESTALSGVRAGLKQLDGIGDIEVLEVWRDHDE